MLGGNRAELDDRDIGLVLVVVGVGAAVVDVRAVGSARVAVIVDMHMQAAELQPEQTQNGNQSQRSRHAVHVRSIHTGNGARTVIFRNIPRLDRLVAQGIQVRSLLENRAAVAQILGAQDCALAEATDDAIHGRLEAALTAIVEKVSLACLAV